MSDFYLEYVGGAQTSMRQQRLALEGAGHTVRLIRSVQRGNLDGRARLQPDAEGLAIRPAFTVPGLMLPVSTARPALVARLRDYLMREHIDVVHLQTEFGLAHAATTAARELGIPVVCTIHTFYWQSTGPWAALAWPVILPGLQYVTRTRFPRERLTRRPSDNVIRNLTLALAKRVDVVISPSAHQAADLAAAGVTAPIRVIQNPIAANGPPATLLTQNQAQDPALLWVARCEPEKRPIAFAEAVIEALGRGARFRTHFVGDGAQLGRLRELTAGHPSIRVHGSLPHEQVIALMEESALVALTSYGFDNQPMTIAESVSRYRGVLYCDPNLTEGLAHGGHLTNGPEPSAIADAIVELTGDPRRLVALSEGARRDSVGFSPAAFVEAVTAAYSEAAERAG